MDYPDNGSDTVQQIDDDFDLDIEIAGDAQELDQEDARDSQFSSVKDTPVNQDRNPASFYEDSPHHGKKKMRYDEDQFEE